MVQFIVALIVVLFILGKSGGKGSFFTLLGGLIIFSFLAFPAIAIFLVIATVIVFVIYLIRR